MMLYKIFPRLVASTRHSFAMPQAIALPNIRHHLKSIVKYPPTPPANPPSDRDVALAINLSHEIFAARRQFYTALQIDKRD